MYDAEAIKVIVSNLLCCVNRDEKSTMKRYNQKVMDYVNQDESRAPSSDLMRPPSIMGKDGRETPVIRLDSPASDRYNQNDTVYRCTSDHL